MQKIIFLFFYFTTITTSVAQSTNFAWAKTIGGSGSDYASDIAVDSMGNTYITGMYNDTLDFDPSSGVYKIPALGLLDAYVIKLSPNGDLIWTRTFGTGNGVVSGFSLTLDNAGNVYTTGTLKGIVDFDGSANTSLLGVNDGKVHIFISKMTTNGDFVWAKEFGASRELNVVRVAVDDMQNIYATGRFKDTIDFDPGPNTYNLINNGINSTYIVKLTNNGSFSWVKTFQGTGRALVTDLTLSSNNDIQIIGGFQGNVDFDTDPNTSFALNPITPVFGSITAFIMKMNASGGFVWAKAIDGLNASVVGTSISIDKQNNLYVLGTYSNTVDFDPNAGVYEMTGGAGFLLKLTPNADFLWVKPIQFTSYYSINRVTVDNDGNPYIIGYFSGVLDCDPSAATYNLTTATSDYDGFMLKLSTAGNFLWAGQIGDASGSVDMDSSCMDKMGNVYTVGHFYGTNDFNTDSLGIFNLTTAGNNDIFIQKLGTTIVNTQNIAINNPNITVFPNPTTSDFDVFVEQEQSNLKFNIYNSTGVLIKQMQSNNSKTNIPMIEQSAGLYVIEIICENKTIGRKKIIKL
jgi:hypothetical protein